MPRIAPEFFRLFFLCPGRTGGSAATARSASSACGARSAATAAATPSPQPFQAPAARAWRPFAAIGHWPDRQIGAPVHVRLSREKRPRLGGAAPHRRPQLPAARRRPRRLGAGRRADADIIAAMRTGIEMVVETRSTRGRLVRDQYRLRGAATAMDAAALACVRGG